MNLKDLKTGLLILLLSYFFSVNAPAIERVASAGAREAALSWAVVALPGSFAVFHNQALLTENAIPIASICYRQPYFIPGYHESALSLVYPIHAAVVALGLNQSALAGYKESNFGISIAKILTGKISAGLLINYFDMNFPETGRHMGSFQIDGGISYKYSDKLILGFHLRNMAQSKIETFQYDMAFPLEITSGFSYRLTERILIAGESMMERETGIGIRCGIEYQILNNFLVRGGVSTNPFQHSFGFGYIYRFCQLDFALVHHELLGFEPTISINFIFK